MAEKWDCILHILEKDDRELQEAMTAQVGTIFSHTTSSSRMEFLKTFTDAGIIAHGTARKEADIIDHIFSWMSLILIKIDSLPFPFSTQGLNPSLGMVEAALILYEREEGSMPKKVSYAEKNFTNRGSRSQWLLQSVLFFLAFIKIHPVSSNSILFSPFFFSTQN